MGHCHKFQEWICKRSTSYPLCWLGEWRLDSYWKELHPSARPLETRPLQSDPLINIKPNQKHKSNSASLPYLARKQINHLPMMVLLTVPASLSKSSSIKSTNSFSTYKNTWITNIVQLEEDFHIHQQRTVPQTAVLLNLHGLSAKHLRLSSNDHGVTLGFSIHQVSICGLTTVTILCWFCLACFPCTQYQM